MRVEELCPSAALAIECERRFQANLRALSQVAPEAARSAREQVVVVTRLERGRDGSVLCRIEAADGRRLLVGGTVVPRWAAEQMLGSLALPPCGHLFLAPLDGGHNLLALLEATYRHQNIFVLERDLDIFAATLMVCDLRSAIASGRVKFFVGEDLAGQVVRYLRAHPWEVAPQHLITTSTLPDVVAAYREEVAQVETLLAETNRPGESKAA